MSQSITLTIYLFGLCAAGSGLILLLTCLLGKVNGLRQETAPVFTAIAIPLSLIMARLLYVLLNIKAFLESYENPALLFCFWDGGLSMTGAILGVVLAALIAARCTKTRFGRLSDAFAAPLSLSLALLFFGEQFTDLGCGKSVSESFLTRIFPFLFSVEKMGILTTYNLQPWKYECFAFLILFAVTLLYFSRNHLQEGNTALFFFPLAGAVTLFLESMRDDGHMLIIFLRVAQLGGLLMVLLPLAIISRRWHNAGGEGKSLLIAWGAELIAIIGIILIEFALDGRLSFGARSMGVNYAAMLGCVALMAASPCVLLQHCHGDSL